MKQGITYSQAGVNINAGNELVRRIKPLVENTNRQGSMSDFGGFGGRFDLRAAGYVDPILVAATDGVGTKLRIAIDSQRLETIGIDLVAMCVNDLVCQGAEPLFFLDYFATAKLSVDEAERVVAGIANGCRQAECSLIGGETAEMPGLYAQNDFDLAGFAVGAVTREQMLPRKIQVGDILLGLASNGLHSNGYSLVRRIVSQSSLHWEAECPWEEGTLGEVLLRPTRIYAATMQSLLADREVIAISHITGGGLTENIPRMLPADLGAEVDLSVWKLPAIFRWFADQGPISKAEFLRTFNAGIGLVLAVRERQADQISDKLQNMGEQVWQIGRVVDGSGVSYKGTLF
ncbi:MAG: phosphoribosylformylglycinamidine cyclo-ligase [Aestuariivita sp.]|nr:phosphoribosylformylglycinamidine cyclo-ligase [Aestuariivita sp.]MCY4200999.1 phosphoribosylformylglycinamidine cyclo-ligase [Aestuariivita sp.]MCY4287408.1 phosphoribosylformylglycinamidine cyclo-ligase [Aestuariivita sp.]MCY4347880.1 phosphoribosylformylglycinamidine cyclo-ligase [Aestuariivita sp.]